LSRSRELQAGAPLRQPLQIYIMWSPGSTTRRLRTGFNASLIIQLSNGFEVEIPNYELSNPLRGIDVNGARMLNPNITQVNIFSEKAPLDTATLPKIFLSQVSYLNPCLLVKCMPSDSQRRTWSLIIPSTNSGSLPSC